MDSIILILNRYNLGNIIKIETIDKGRTANAWMVETEKGNYVLRSLKNKSQGEVEFSISNHVNSNYEGIVPLIISTSSGHKYVEFDNQYFNLQSYISGDLLKKNDSSSFIKLGKSIGLLHKNLQTLSLNESPEDRFDMLQCWEKLNTKWDKLHQLDSDSFVSYDQMNKYIIQLYQATSERNQIIHGDLGIWNIISTGDNVVIIDFGEAKVGHKYFDISGAITSSINTEESQKNTILKVKGFILEYEKQVGKVDLVELNNYIQLWLTRGLLTLISMKNIENINSKTVKKYISDSNYFEALFGNNFANDHIV